MHNPRIALSQAARIARPRSQIAFERFISFLIFRVKIIKQESKDKVEVYYLRRKAIIELHGCREMEKVLDSFLGTFGIQNSSETSVLLGSPYVLFFTFHFEQKTFGVSFNKLSQSSKS